MRRQLQRSVTHQASHPQGKSAASKVEVREAQPSEEEEDRSPARLTASVAGAITLGATATAAIATCAWNPAQHSHVVRYTSDMREVAACLPSLLHSSPQHCSASR